MAATIATPTARRTRPVRAGFTRRYQPMLLVLIAFAAGIALDRWLMFPPLVSWCVAAAMLLGWFVAWRGRRARAAAALLAVSIAALGAAWHHAWWNLYPADEIGLFAEEEPHPVAVEAIVLDSPQYDPASGSSSPLDAIPSGPRSKMRLEVTALRRGEQWQPASGETELLIDGQVLGIARGDRVRVFGLLSKPAPPMNPGEFDFARHARADRHLSLLWGDVPECVSVVERGRWMPGYWLDALRRKGDELLWNNISLDHRPLAAALLLGSREQLAPEQTDAFFRTGMIHVISISGLHVGLLALGLLAILRLAQVRRGAAMLAVAGLVVAYLAVIRAEPPALRATIVLVIACLASYLGRGTLAANIWAAAAVVVLALNPADLFRAGPQLSFLAAAVLVWFGRRWYERPEPDPLAQLIAESRPWWQRTMIGVGRGLLIALAVSTAVWLTTLPLIAAQFHIVSPISLVLTPLVAPLVAVGLLSGFGLLTLGAIAPPLARMFGAICDACFEGTSVCIDWASSLSWGHAWVFGPPHWWVLCFYAVLAVTVAWPNVKLVRGTLIGWSVLGLVLSLPTVHKSDELRCTFASVGHGLSVLLELPDGRTILYDAGRLGSPPLAAHSVSALLWSRKLQSVDAMIVSHADVDHFNGMPELLRRFGVGALLMTRRTRESDSEAVAELIHAADRAGVPIQLVSGGDVIEAGDVEIEILLPPPEGLDGSDNANSLVLAITYRGKSILLTGDLETVGLTRLLASPKRPIDILSSPHHGSMNSNPRGMARWCTPRWAVISGRRERAAAAVVAAYAAEEVTTYHTCYDGAVTFTISADGIDVKTFRPGSDLSAAAGLNSLKTSESEGPALTP